MLKPGPQYQPSTPLVVHESLPTGDSYTMALVPGGTIGCVFQSYHLP